MGQLLDTAECLKEWKPSFAFVSDFYASFSESFWCGWFQHWLKQLIGQQTVEDDFALLTKRECTIELNLMIGADIELFDLFE